MDAVGIRAWKAFCIGVMVFFIYTFSMVAIYQEPLMEQGKDLPTYVTNGWFESGFLYGIASALILFGWWNMPWNNDDDWKPGIFERYTYDYDEDKGWTRKKKYEYKDWVR